MQHSGEGYVYIFKIHEFCKIGISSDPKRRMKQVSTLSPYEVEKFYVSRLFENPEDVERKMHSYFWKEREHGEWFKIPFNTAVEVLELYTKSFKTIDEGARMRLAAERLAEALGY